MEALIAALAGLVTSLISSGQQGKADELRKSVLDKFGPEILPQLDLAIAEQQDTTQLGAIKEDGSLRAQQLRAIRALESEYENGGMGEGDTAALRRAQDIGAGQAASNYGSLAQSLAARGQSLGGGLGVAAAAQAGQDGVNTSARLAGDAQIAARQRALQALESSSQLSGQVRNTDWGHASQVAGAQDAINAFNTSAKERANFYNLGLPQQQFDNRMTQLTAEANAANGVAAGYERGAGRANAMGAGFGNAGITASNYQGGGGGGDNSQQLYDLSNNPYPSATDDDEWKEWGE